MRSGVSAFSDKKSTLSDSKKTSSSDSQKNALSNSQKNALSNSQKRLNMLNQQTSPTRLHFTQNNDLKRNENPLAQCTRRGKREV